MRVPRGFLTKSFCFAVSYARFSFLNSPLSPHRSTITLKLCHLPGKIDTSPGKPPPLNINRSYRQSPFYVSPHHSYQKKKKTTSKSLFFTRSPTIISSFDALSYYLKYYIALTFFSFFFFYFNCQLSVSYKRDRLNYI